MFVYTVSMAENLSEKDADVVFEFLYDARVKWYELGLQLKVTTQDLDVIKLSSHNKLLGMLKQWLRSAENTTWPHIVEALQCRSVGLLDLARRVRDKHCREYLLHSQIPGKAILFNACCINLLFYPAHSLELPNPSLDPPNPTDAEQLLDPPQNPQNPSKNTDKLKDKVVGDDGRDKKVSVTYCNV